MVKILLQYMLKCLHPGMRVKIEPDRGNIGGFSISNEQGFVGEGVIFLSSAEDALNVFPLGKTSQSLWASRSAVCHILA